MKPSGQAGRGAEASAYHQGYRAGCTRVAVVACISSECRREVTQLLQSIEGLVVKEAPGYLLEAPLRLAPIVEYFVETMGVSPDEIVVVVDTPVLDEREVREELGFVKILDVLECRGERLKATVEASMCRSVKPECIIDFGLGWIQA